MTFILTTVIIGTLIGAVLLFLVRRDHIHGAYAIWWAFVAISVFLFGLFPGVIDWVGRQLGIAYPPVLILVIGICLMLVKMLTMDIERSRQERKIRRLAQRMAILESLLEQHEEALRRQLPRDPR